MLSADESSEHSSTGHSFSTARQRLQQHPSLHYHLMPIPIKGQLPSVKPFRENIGKFQDLKTPREAPSLFKKNSSEKMNPFAKIIKKSSWKSSRELKCSQRLIQKVEPCLVG
ncbi:hypothetical protein V6N13_000918 [Hibiscus sabdariffa]|uniref:Uncharacterized protein n=2 Tax=Hibiscus sabdariffa TaxID=183260 RepID=A0ABR2G7N6_9ROSI